MISQKSMVSQTHEYLEHRRELGFKLRIEGQLLLNFAKYADQTGHCGSVTTELALRWAQLPRNAARLYYARRLEIVRCFAKHQAIADRRTQIPPGGLLGSAHRRIQPHIYSEEQLGELMRAAGSLSPKDGLRPLTYTALFGTLISTGLRISEALRLRRVNVDLGSSC